MFRRPLDPRGAAGAPASGRRRTPATILAGVTVSIRDVARHVGVSVATVSNVINGVGRVSPAVAERVLRAIDELDYVRNDAARQLRAGRSRTVGVVVLDVRNPYYADVARATEDAAAPLDLNVVIGDSDGDPARESAHLALFEEQRVHGVIVAPVGDVDARLQRLRNQGIPSVLIDRVSSDPAFSSVSVDDVAGGRMAIEHLLAAGRRRLAFVGGPSQFQHVIDRREGVRRAVEAAGGATLEEIPTASLSVPEGRRVGELLVARAPADRPDGIFAASDQLAIGMLHVLAFAGKRLVPDEIALIGFDDIDFATHAVVPLSSIRQPSRLIGETALHIVAEEADTLSLPPRHIVFQPELVVRTSTTGADARAG